MQHKSFTSYFLLLLTSSEALIPLSQRSNHFGRRQVKSKGTTVKNRWKYGGNNDRLRGIG